MIPGQSIREKITMEDQILQLANAIQESSFTVAVTGAGISLSAGGVTFAGMMPSMRGALLSRNPEKQYRALYQTFLKAAFEHGPTAAHRALARLEEMGRLQGIITTNEDCIHTIAGSKNVAELEGSYQVNTCEDCGYRNFDYEIWNQGHMPTCPTYLKNSVSSSASYAHSGEYFRGWTALNHVSLLYFYGLLNALRDKGLSNKYTPEDVIKLTKNIYRVDVGDEDGYRVSAIQKKTQELLDKLGVDLLRNF